MQVNIKTTVPGSGPVSVLILAPQEAILNAHEVNVFYGDKQALFDVDLVVQKNAVTALIGPSGCGKSTLLRCFNRMNDVIAICKVTGSITLGGQDIHAPLADVVALRQRVAADLWAVIAEAHPGDASNKTVRRMGELVQAMVRGCARKWWE